MSRSYLTNNDTCNICKDIAIIRLTDFKTRKSYLLCKKHRDGWIMSHMQCDNYIQLMNEDKTIDFVSRSYEEDADNA